MTLRVLIIDDEELARARLRRLLEGEADLEVLGECADGPSAIKAVRQLNPNLILLDVQMPVMDGFEVLRALSSETLPAVIFVTAFDQHAVRAFETRALDYLLKPTTRARLRDALARARERVGVRGPITLPPALLELLTRDPSSPRVRRFAVRTGERVTFVDAEEIDWIEAAGNYVLLHVRKETHIVRETMTALETQLPANTFLRVSRSAIVNLRRIKELQTISPGDHVAILVDGQRVPMTRSVREVEERLRFG